MLNKVVLMGRLVKDPETTITTSGMTVTRFTIAVDRRFQKQGEEKKTDFLNIVTFSKTAEFVQRNFGKGQLAAICGSIQTRSWEQDGQKRYATDIIADEVYFGGSKKEPTSEENSNVEEYTFGTITDDDTLPF